MKNVVRRFVQPESGNKDGTQQVVALLAAGVDGAQPGIVMEASPKVGDTYRQEYYPGEAEDMATVLNVN